MTTTPAMPELHRDQIIDLISPLSKNSADHDIEFANRVIDALATLQAQPAAVSDAEIERVLALAHAYADAKLMRYGLLGIKDLPDPQVAYEDLERAILALRPQAVPMSRDDLKVLMSETGYVHATAQEKADFINGFRHAEAHHGITAQAKEGGSDA